MLQVGEGNQRHQRMPVQARPGSALEVVEPKLLLELLMRLLANPARLDDGREPLSGVLAGMLER